MRYKALGRTGLQVSQIGFGASPLGDVFEKTDPRQRTRAVHLAIERGINFFDVSPFYGLTLAEQRLGEALLGKREDVILATKCGRYGTDLFDFSGASVKTSIDESLRRLRTDYVDLLQVHDVEFGEERRIVEETIPALREIQQAGKARFIGVTGYQTRMLARIAHAALVDTVLSYCRYDLLVTSMDEVLTPLTHPIGTGCVSRIVGLINASPLHMGILTEQGAPAWHPAPPEVHAAGRRVAELCRKRGVDVAQVALRFCLDHPQVSSTLVGMATTAHVECNLKALDTPNDPHLIDEIRRAIGPAFNIVWPSGRPENYD